MINDFLRRGIGNLVLIIVVITMAGCSRRVISVEQVKRMIQDKAPVGCDKQQAQSFIDNLHVNSLKITRGEFYKVNKQKRPGGLWDPEKEFVALWDRVDEMVVVRIVDAKVGFMNRNDIIIVFAIDKEAKMIGYSVMSMGSE